MIDRIRARWLITATCVLGLLAASGTPTASARTLAQARSLCPDGSVCVFEHVNWDGRYVSFRSGISDFRAFGFNDVASSYINDGSSTFCLYQNVKFAWPNDLGRSYKIRAWAWEWSLHDWPYFGDMASSGIKWYASQNCNYGQVN